MSPTRDELELGGKAYRQVRLYENSMKDFRQTHWVLAICGGLVLVGLLFWMQPYWPKWPKDHLWFWFIPWCLVVGIWQNRAAKERYATQQMLLKLLEEKYGDALPWIVEEKQLASARELEAVIARERPASHA